MKYQRKCCEAKKAKQNSERKKLFLVSQKQAKIKKEQQRDTLS
jgi:hypothetical protein